MMYKLKIVAVAVLVACTNAAKAYKHSDMVARDLSTARAYHSEVTCQYRAVKDRYHKSEQLVDNLERKYKATVASERSMDKLYYAETRVYDSGMQYRALALENGVGDTAIAVKK